MWRGAKVAYFFNTLCIFPIFIEDFGAYGNLPRGLLDGLTLLVMFAYPCFMWILINKPANYSFSGYFHWGLGWLGVGSCIQLGHIHRWDVEYG
ncbi:hypothetical protein IGI04_040510 [Brassica rapa subsp. trilocularis]|uniref:Amino acid transporter transmembrane domain-containing protein n=1 Tax=Brassica rapa subsp. trilocularis TaxID=1813537 RepID=A0ABQ7KRI8_BRACM|nr:hypothetical protein IGI04_040510 [Brassica rapa subsp. trilocularis]